jgi:hypothetical protein
MDALKIVPQAFFDAIARVFPGLLALFLIAWFEPGAWCTVSDALNRLLGNGSDTLSPFALIFMAFAIGHLMSPGTKLVQYVAEKYPKIPPKEEDHGSKTLFGVLKTAYKCLKGFNSEEEIKDKLKPISERYDWLRVHSPEGGSLSAKLRAEFTMYNSLAFVFFTVSVRLFFTFRMSDYLIPVLLLGLGLLMAMRGRETQTTMRKCVNNFFSAETEPDKLKTK